MSSAALYHQVLQDEFARRCDKNSRYSLRAFARALRVEPSALSQILSKTRVPSYKMAQKIVKALALAPDEELQFLASLSAVQRSRGLVRLNPRFRKLPAEAAAAARPRELSIELFRVIADLYHYCILELTYVEGFNSDPTWIGSQLGISASEAKLAIQRLLDLGLLEETNGKLQKSLEQITTADKSITHAPLKRHQKQVLEKALHSLENDPIECRSNTSMTMAIDPELLPKAKTMIEAFTNQLCVFLESGSRKQVYEMSINLFPIQKKPQVQGEIE